MSLPSALDRLSCDFFKIKYFGVRLSHPTISLVHIQLCSCNLFYEHADYESWIWAISTLAHMVSEDFQSIRIVLDHSFLSQYWNKSAEIKFASPVRIEKIMCPHITLQNSGHRDYLFLAGREPRQRSLSPLLWHGAPVGSGAAQNAHGSQSKHEYVCSSLQGTANCGGK